MRIHTCAARLRINYMFIISCVCGLAGSVEGNNRGSDQKGPTASVRCDGSGVKFRLPDYQIFRKAFVNPTAVHGAKVESVLIGNEKEAECFASRFGPDPNDPSPQSGFSITLNYSQCNFKTTVNDKQIAYENVATATLLYAAPPGTKGISRRRQFRIPIRCTTSSVVNVISGVSRETIVGRTRTGSTSATTSTSRVSTTQSFAALTSNVNASIQMETRTSDAKFDHSVYILTLSLDVPSRNEYSVLGKRCWASPSFDNNSTIRYEFLSAQGWNDVNSDNLLINRTSPYEIIYEISDFEFEGTEADSYYFFCEVNVCSKSSIDQSRCEPQLCANRTSTVCSTVSDLLLFSSQKRPDESSRIRPLVVPLS